AERVGGERWVTPELQISRRHYVGMAGKAEMRRTLADPRIEIVDRLGALAETQALAPKAPRLERLDQDLDRAAVARRYALAADQTLRERELPRRSSACVRTARSTSA